MELSLYLRACTGERQGSDTIDIDDLDELQQLTWWSKKKYD